MIQQQLLFYLGAGLLVAGVVPLYIGASLLSSPVACVYSGCPSTAIYWDEVYAGIAMITPGASAMTISTVSMQHRDLSSDTEERGHRASAFYKGTLVGISILGASMVLLGFIVDARLVSTPSECSAYVPCWPPLPGPDPFTLFLLGAYLFLFSLFIWRLRIRT
jgi:hypothetical protein